MYSISRIGPRTEPCGIPDLNGMGADLQPSDRMFPMTTDWVLLVRYEQVMYLTQQNAAGVAGEE